jgi:hypothetical protein
VNHVQVTVRMLKQIPWLNCDRCLEFHLHSAYHVAHTAKSQSVTSPYFPFQNFWRSIMLSYSCHQGFPIVTGHPDTAICYFAVSDEVCRDYRIQDGTPDARHVIEDWLNQQSSFELPGDLESTVFPLTFMPQQQAWEQQQVCHYCHHYIEDRVVSRLTCFRFSISAFISALANITKCCMLLCSVSV